VLTGAVGEQDCSSVVDQGGAARESSAARSRCTASYGNAEAATEVATLIVIRADTAELCSGHTVTVTE